MAESDDLKPFLDGMKAAGDFIAAEAERGPRPVAELLKALEAERERIWSATAG